MQSSLDLFFRRAARKQQEEAGVMAVNDEQLLLSPRMKLVNVRVRVHLDKDSVK